MKCNLCLDLKEIKIETVRTIGYTLTPGENIDEHLVPCPECSSPNNEIQSDAESGVCPICGDPVENYRGGSHYCK